MYLVRVRPGGEEQVREYIAPAYRSPKALVQVLDIDPIDGEMTLQVVQMRKGTPLTSRMQAAMDKALAERRAVLVA